MSQKLKIENRIELLQRELQFLMEDINFGLKNPEGEKINKKMMGITSKIHHLKKQQLGIK